MAAFCDYDRDGWLDVYIATNLLDNARHPNGQRGYLFHNNRNGTFTNVTEKAGISGESQSHSATWWDFDSDGWPDLYVANDYGVPDKLYHNNRDGTFTDVDRPAAAPHLVLLDGRGPGRREQRRDGSTSSSRTWRPRATRRTSAGRPTRAGKRWRRRTATRRRRSTTATPSS